MHSNKKPVDLEEDEVLEAFQKARELNLCPNRLWTVIGENLPKLLPTSVLVPVEKGKTDERNNFNNHDDCTSDFCEYAQRDFTAVVQRHECGNEENCRLTDRFSREMLDNAAEAEKSTVWDLDENVLLGDHLPYMAISHVWADGTGTGAWEAGRVNECLWKFFRDIAKKFQCEGIWWDTLCIPRQKAARNKAIEKIQRNYQDAQITLVHDHFLRSWEWDPETACFAILMSPWFSRGWTALELAKSRKVKVMFKGSYGPIIKDLDEEILVKDSKHNSASQKASQIIQSLRKNIDRLNDLLNVLGPRYTSWPKDIATISALLVGVPREEQQQGTYKRILKKFGRLAPGHLFHNSATMRNEFSWCPAKLFDLPLDDSEHCLSISPNGDIHGKWIVMPVDSKTERTCWWGGTHSLMRRKLQAALRNHQMCCLLVEHYPGNKATSVDRALLVRKTKVSSRYQYLGALYFYRKLGEEGLPSSGCEKEITISSYQKEPEEAVSGQAGNMFTDGKKLPQPKNRKVTSSKTVFDAHAFDRSIWHGNYETFSTLLKGATPDYLRQIQRRNQYERPHITIPRPLHLASSRGDIRMVRDLLKCGAALDTRCSDGATALHFAAWSGSVDVVKELLECGIDASAKQEGDTALHIAAKMGFGPIAELLIRKTDFNSKGRNGLTSLHLAAMGGYTTVVKILERANVQIQDDLIGWTALHYAASFGDPDLIKLLIERGAVVDTKDDKVGWTPLHIAAMNGYNEAVNALLPKESQPAVQDKYGWTPRQFAELNGHAQTAEVLYHKESNNANGISTIENSLTFLHCRTIHDGRFAIQRLFDKDNDCFFVEIGDKKTLRQFTVDVALGTAIRELLEESANDIKNYVQLPLHRGARRWQRLEATFKRAKGQKECWKTLQSASTGGPEGFTWLFIQNFVSYEGYYGSDGSLHIAVREGDENLIRLLLLKGAGAYINLTNADNGTPLMLAVQKGDEALTRLLLKEGADPNIPGEDAHSPLSYAVRQNGGIARLLLESGADPNAPAIDGETVLMEAVLEGNEEMIQLLLREGADMKAEDSYGRNLLDYAITGRSERFAQWLRGQGMRETKAGRQFNSP